MLPIARKRIAECPRCHGLEVHVPWEPAATARRRRMLLGLTLLWATSIVWVALGVTRGGRLWLVGLLAYALVTALVLVGWTAAGRAYRCVSCGLRWRGQVGAGGARDDG